MQLFDKEGNAANCDTSQVEILLKAGWTKEPFDEEAAKAKADEEAAQKAKELEEAAKAKADEEAAQKGNTKSQKSKG